MWCELNTVGRLRGSGPCTDQKLSRPLSSTVLNAHSAVLVTAAWTPSFGNGYQSCKRVLV